MHAFITSRLDYCNSLLYGVPDCLVAKLQRLQNPAARLISRAPTFCHITPIRDLHWLNIRSRIDYNISLTTFQAINGIGPNYLNKLVEFKRSSGYGLRSNNTYLLKPYDKKTLPTLGDRAFVGASPRMWNSLPLQLREPQGLETFK